MNHEFCIVDIETTGSGLQHTRITEICIVRFRESEIISKYTTLIDPQCFIPSFITNLTGIDNDTVAKAPTFDQVAIQILEETKDAVFVAHNVNYDYNVLRNEFKRLEIEFQRKKLCTVRMARKLIPGLPSYSLGRLCNSLEIAHNNHHRAEGDTDATVLLFQKLLTQADSATFITKALHISSKEGTLPPGIDPDQFINLPVTPGVYLFKNKDQKVIYVGKAINIKKRVLSHFYSKNNKSYAMCQEVSFIEHIDTGSELVALLQEAELINHYFPKFNSAQKLPRQQYQIMHYKNQLGITQLAVGLVKSYDYSMITHYKRSDAVIALEQICEEYELCPKYCSLQTNVSACDHFKLRNCKGVCRNDEKISLYNIRAYQAIENLKNHRDTFIIQQPGRKTNELCFILIRNNNYAGYGFVDRYETINSIEDAESFLEKKKANYHTNQILASFLKKTGDTHIVFKENTIAEEYLN